MAVLVVIAVRVGIAPVTEATAEEEDPEAEMVTPTERPAVTTVLVVGEISAVVAVVVVLGAVMVRVRVGVGMGAAVAVVVMVVRVGVGAVMVVVMVVEVEVVAMGEAVVVGEVVVVMVGGGLKATTRVRSAGSAGGMTRGARAPWLTLAAAVGASSTCTR